ncbi:hypothetical protein [Acidimangrovimonas sediminis]|uniref:hypothetical protein n=1 Tax=Acidimangrovimonas sediminis TaxID=2056283 RepID=UPI0011AEFDC1|nr:hypothetical protein [Acidimangrovimonas sediminis]
MAFAPKPELVQFSILSGPARRQTVWVIYPGLPPIMHAFGIRKTFLRPSGEPYGIEDLCWMIALECLPKIYGAMSGHEKIAVHAAEEEALRALRDAGEEIEAALADPASRFS